MNVVVTCPLCRKRLQAAKALVGKVVPCPLCGAHFKLHTSCPPVPSLVLSSAPSAATPQSIRAEMVDEFTGNQSTTIAGGHGSHQRRLLVALMLLVGVGVMAVMGTVALLVSSTVTATPDQDDFKQTLRWAEREMSPLASLAAQRNELVLAEKKSEILRDLQPLVGQTVEWPLTVTDVTADAVYLEDDYQSVVFRQAISAHWEPSMYVLIIGAEGLVVPIGTGLSYEEARQLTKGDRLLVRAQITGVEIAHQDRHLKHWPKRSHDVSGYALVITVSDLKSASGSGGASAGESSTTVSAF